MARIVYLARGARSLPTTLWFCGCGTASSSRATFHLAALLRDVASAYICGSLAIFACAMLTCSAVRDHCAYDVAACHGSSLWISAWAVRFGPVREAAVKPRWKEGELLNGGASGG